MERKITVFVTCLCSFLSTGINAHSMVTITPPGVTPVCEDKLSTCNMLDVTFYCVGEYYNYALENCQKTCKLCNNKHDFHRTPVQQPTASSRDWILVMKGVAGAPGPDLYQLWHSGQTLNPDVPEAKTLTPVFNGHYKPDYSNHWKDLCIDQVKVGIYKQGVEKAFIIFNATGADKNSWFTPDRILSSSWTDLKSAHKQIFSMAGDATTGREFYINGHSSATDNCDSFGWFMVSTKVPCFFEAGYNKPTFLYAPGTNQAHWGFTNPGTGDVFAIQAHSQCPPTTGGQSMNGPHTTSAAVCEYRGKQYTQSQTWADGCQYNCTCFDASIGYYRCKNLCPVYGSLPKGCKLNVKTGECCAEVICDVGAIKRTPFEVIPAFCVYKGQYYTQDQTWNDGCSQSCTCTNADQGMYSCRAVCLNWDKLPAICHLEGPPPGLCCKQPKCPNGIVINIPKAYKDKYPGYIYV